MSDPKTAEALILDPQTTALVLIDLQKRVLAMNTAPYSGADVVKTGAAMASRCRVLGIPVVLVNVDFRPGGGDRVTAPVDTPMAAPAVPMPDGAVLVPELQATAQDILITKHQWGAFYGTDLDLQLRRRGIKTLLLGGIATNFGVESTARDAWERNFAVVFLEDAMTSITAEAHLFSVAHVFPRIGRVRSCAQVLQALR